MTEQEPPQASDHGPAGNGWLGLVREQVKSLRYGVVQIVVHDSRVVQIERTEKTRLEGGIQGRSGCPHGGS